MTRGRAGLPGLNGGGIVAVANPHPIDSGVGSLGKSAKCQCYKWSGLFYSMFKMSKLAHWGGGGAIYDGLKYGFLHWSYVNTLMCYCDWQTHTQEQLTAEQIKILILFCLHDTDENYWIIRISQQYSGMTVNSFGTSYICRQKAECNTGTRNIILLTDKNVSNSLQQKHRYNIVYTNIFNILYYIIFRFTAYKQSVY